MFRKVLSTFVTGILLTGGVLSATPNIQTSADHTSQIAIWKEQVSKRGVDERSKWKVELADGRKLTGYTGEIGDDGFTLVDLKTGASHQIKYNQISRLNPNVGMSRGAKIAVIAGVAVGAYFAIGAIWRATSKGN
jgi:hypothetical protein